MPLEPQNVFFQHSMIQNDHNPLPSTLTNSRSEGGNAGIKNTTAAEARAKIQ